MPDFCFFGMFFALLGVAEVAAGLPLMLRLVKPNPFFGLHLSATRADETVWYDANAGTGRGFARPWDRPANCGQPAAGVRHANWNVCSR